MLGESDMWKDTSGGDLIVGWKGLPKTQAQKSRIRKTVPAWSSELKANPAQQGEWCWWLKA